MHKSQLQRQAEEVERIDAAIAEELAASKEAPQESEEVAETETSEVLETQEETQAPLPDPTPPPVQDDSAKWEQRYNTLVGKYNAEVPRLSSEIKELKNSLEAAVSRLNEKAEAKPEVAAKVEKLITAQDAENYGEDMVDFVKRAAADIVSDRERDLAKEIKSLKELNNQLKKDVGSVAEVQSKATMDQMLVRLEQLVPDWQSLNVDPAFLDWLAEPDPMSGYTRHQLLQTAEQNLDAPQLANIFNSFKQTRAPVAAPPPPKPSKPDVQQHVTPGKSKSSNTGSRSEEANKVWTGNEIDQFYNDVRQGKYKTKPDDARKIESQIDLAVQQGRIR